MGLTPGITQHVNKVTQFRKDGMGALRRMVVKLRTQQDQGMDDRILPPPRSVYPEDKMKRDMHYFEEVDYYKQPNRLFEPEEDEENKKRVSRHQARRQREQAT
jgi:large subunit ribosomal protein L17